MSASPAQGKLLALVGFRAMHTDILVVVVDGLQASKQTRQRFLLPPALDHTSRRIATEPGPARPGHCQGRRRISDLGAGGLRSCPAGRRGGEGCSCCKPPRSSQSIHGRLSMPKIACCSSQIKSLQRRPFVKRRGGGGLKIPHTHIAVYFGWDSFCLARRQGRGGRPTIGLVSMLGSSTYRDATQRWWYRVGNSRLWHVYSLPLPRCTEQRLPRQHGVVSAVGALDRTVPSSRQLGSWHGREESPQLRQVSRQDRDGGRGRAAARRQTRRVSEPRDGARFHAHKGTHTQRREERRDGESCATTPCGCPAGLEDHQETADVRGDRQIISQSRAARS